MITIFNRKELCSVYSMKEQSNIRIALTRSNIDYHIKTINRMSSSPFSSGTRSRAGSYGQKQELNYQYIFYVHKKDFNKASMLVGKTRV
ncbi:hypothetical protein [Gudongella sp. SC589]|uniref:hypothetical protein n=1 Tax=Gudongella sp. SC589 TaxID=3385990 RepID=UPI003904A127